MLDTTFCVILSPGAGKESSFVRGEQLEVSGIQRSKGDASLRQHDITVEEKLKTLTFSNSSVA